MKLGEALQMTQSLYSKGAQSQDSRLRPRHIYNQLLKSRATLSVQKFNKGQKFSQWDYLTISCLELVPAEKHECPCLPPTGCVVLKSKYPLPKFITGIDKDIIQSISSIDGSLILDQIDFATNKYLKGNKYTSKKPHYYIYNDYLFVTVTKALKIVQVTALFEDPIAVWTYPSLCDCADCCLDIYEKEFPLADNMMDTAADMAAQKLLAIFVQMREDKNNDASDNAGTAGAMIHQPTEQ